MKGRRSRTTITPGQAKDSWLIRLRTEDTFATASPYPSPEDGHRRWGQ